MRRTPARPDEPRRCLHALSLSYAATSNQLHEGGYPRQKIALILFLLASIPVWLQARLSILGGTRLKDEVRKESKKTSSTSYTYIVYHFLYYCATYIRSLSIYSHNKLLRLLSRSSQASLTPSHTAAPISL